MRPLPLLFFALALATTLAAAEPYPLWDGLESVADYARRVNLPPTKALVRSQQQRRYAPRRTERGEQVRSVRHARQRLAMV